MCKTSLCATWYDLMTTLQLDLTWQRVWLDWTNSMTWLDKEYDLTGQTVWLDWTKSMTWLDKEYDLTWLDPYNRMTWLWLDLTKSMTWLDLTWPLQQNDLTLTWLTMLRLGLDLRLAFSDLLSPLLKSMYSVCNGECWIQAREFSCHNRQTLNPWFHFLYNQLPNSCQFHCVVCK